MLSQRKGSLSQLGAPPASGEKQQEADQRGSMLLAIPPRSRRAKIYAATSKRSQGYGKRFFSDLICEEGLAKRRLIALLWFARHEGIDSTIILWQAWSRLWCSFDYKLYTCSCDQEQTHLQLCESLLQLEIPTKYQHRSKCQDVIRLYRHRFLSFSLLKTQNIKVTIKNYAQNHSIVWIIVSQKTENDQKH